MLCLRENIEPIFSEDVANGPELTFGCLAVKVGFEQSLRLEEPLFRGNFHAGHLRCRL
jgi:hypothetical protein